MSKIHILIVLFIIFGIYLTLLLIFANHVHHIKQVINKSSGDIDQFINVIQYIKGRIIFYAKDIFFFSVMIIGKLLKLH